MEAKFLLISISLILGLIIAYYLLRKISQRGIPGLGGDSPVKVLGTYRLGANRSICLVTIPGSILVLGLTAQDMRLITEIRDEERIREIERIMGRSKGTQGRMPSEEP
jgi:flagellar biogenesis protein FliO